MSSPRLSNSRKRRICLDSSDSDSDDELPFKIKRGREPTIAAQLRHFFRWCTEKYSTSVKEYFSSVMRMGSPMMDTVIVDDEDKGEEEEDEVVVLDEVKKSGKPNPFYDRVKNRHAFINRAIRRQNYDFSEPVLYTRNMFGNRLSSNNMEKDLSSRMHALQTEASNSCFAVEKTLNGSPPGNGIQGHFTSLDQRNGASKVLSQISNPETDIEILLESYEKPPAETDEIQVLSEIPVSKYRTSFKKMPSSKTVHAIRKSSHAQINDVCNEKGAEITLSEGQTRQPPSLFKRYTANEVIRLQEKTKYQQLLNTYFKSQCYHPIKKPTQSVEVQTESSSDPIVLKSLKDAHKQPMDLFIQEHYKPNDYEHRLSSGKPTRHHKRIELPDETLDILELENDLQIMDVQLPKYKLQFDSKPDLSNPMWLSQFRLQIRAETEERKKIEAEQTRRLEILKQQRLNKDVKETIEFKRGRALREIETPELTPEMEAFIEKGLRCSPDKLINNLSLWEIRRRDIETIVSYSWLNDEVINYYLNLIAHRNKEEGLPSVYAFTTFLYPVLKSKGYQHVRKWTRKVDIFSYDILLMPLHLGVHWALAVIYPGKKKIEYYDSMGKTEMQCFDYVNSYLEQEFRDKKGGEFSGDYRIERMDVPQQMNGSDCGMFTLKYSEYIARNAKINFEQENMPYFRRKMVYEMMTNRII